MRVSNPYMMPPQRKMPVHMRSRRRRRQRLRWEILWVLAGLFMAFWLLHHIEPSICFDTLMHSIGVRDKMRYRQLAMLCVIGIGVCLMVRWWRKSPRP